ncbi:MAG: hypothetical protein RLZZ384_685, partial [Pseudomonadota bacterium]
LCILDIDAPTRVDELGVRPFETYAIRTGSGGFHLYYRVIGEYKKVIIHDFEGTHLGELQANGQYCVAEGSLHPNGKQYKAVNPELPVVVKGDSAVQYQSVIDILALLGKLEITQVGLVTQNLVK